MNPTPDTQTTAAIPRPRTRARRRDISGFGLGPDSKLIGLRELCFTIDAGRSSAYKLIALGKLPPPIKSGPTGKRSSWTLGSARQYVASLTAACG
jgi:predicted DNA-binding transcriptional regulator AlpA